MGAQEIKTERLTLRPLLDSDAANITLFVGDERVAKNLSVVPHPYPEGAAESYIAYSRAAETKEAIWGIDKDGQLIGMISIKPADGAMGKLGYWLAPQLWGSGLMSEAVKAVIASAREDQYTRLTADVRQGNEGSAKVLIRNGFSYLGDSECHSLALGGMQPSWQYEKRLENG